MGFVCYLGNPVQTLGRTITHLPTSEHIQAIDSANMLSTPVYLIDNPMICVVEGGMHSFGMLNIPWRNLPAVKNDFSFDYSRASWFCNAGLRLYFSFVSPKYFFHSSVFPSN